MVTSSVKEIFGLPVRISSDVPPTVFLLPPEVTAAIELAEAAERIHAHGIFPQKLVDELWGAATNAGVQAAREGRVGCIKDLE